MEYAKKLVEKGEAYYCFCTPERLASLKTTVNGEEIMTYDKHCLHLSKEEVEATWQQVCPIGTIRSFIAFAQQQNILAAKIYISHHKSHQSETRQPVA